MKKVISRLIILCMVMLSASSCSIRRHVPEGSYLLKKNLVKVEKQAGVSRKEAITSDELTKFIRQRPTKKLLGTNVYLWVYMLSNPKDSSWVNRTLRKIGQPPVIYDSMMSVASVDNMDIYMSGRGFFNSHASFSAKPKKRKITIDYTIKQGVPYRLGKINYDFRDKFLRPIILQDSAATLLHTGEIFSTQTLEDERKRITSNLQNMGYYQFGVSNISYIADSTVGNRTVNLKVVIRQRPIGYAVDGEQIMDNNKVYRVRNIYINPNYDPTVALVDSNYAKTLDTLAYRGVYFLSQGKLNVRPDVIVRALDIFPDELYNAENIKKTYDNILRLNYFKTANFTFTEIADTSVNNLITFIDDTRLGEATQYTKQAYLDFRIHCVPGYKQGYKFELEATTSSDYYGLLFTAGYVNRNLFKSIEIFDLNFTGGYEIMRTVGKRDSYEVGVSTSFTFPRFMLPFRVDRYNRLNMPRTRLELSFNIQNRPYYNRVLSSTALGFTWSNNRFSSYILKPIDLNLIKLNSVNQTFLDSLDNPYLKNSYTSQLIAGISGSYLYNNQLQNTEKDNISLRINAETNGNLLSLMSHLWGHKHGEEGDRYYKIFGVRYAQYVRADVSFVYRYVLAPKTSLVYRFYAGNGVAYGNSVSIPFERMFYCGGSNSMRGWQARTLGPGSVSLPEDIRYPSQLGNLKLETNLEARFPVAGILQGALFFDVGNIWLTGKGIATPEAKFEFNTFYKQLGFNTGLGARLDFGFFLFRLDWGVKLHNPNRPEGQRWIRHFTLRNTAFNFAVGYPF